MPERGRTLHPTALLWHAPCYLHTENKILLTQEMKLLDILNPREIRRRLGLNQEEFWTRIGVTQSGGSRYESGRNMPKPVRELLRLVHVERIDLSRVKKEDFELIDYLKMHYPELYTDLRKAARGKRRRIDESSKH